MNEADNNKSMTKKMVAIMNECGYVAKNGVNQYHHYNYATAEDVLKKVNIALTKHGVASLVLPELISYEDVITQKGSTEHLATVKVTIELLDMESGECVRLCGLGSGQDAGDKAVMKAQTAAIKYAYMMSLCIATGDDPEADATTDECNGQGQCVQTEGSQGRKTIKLTGTLQGEKHVCTVCGKQISDKVNQFSLRRYRRPLCMECQKKINIVA